MTQTQPTTWPEMWVNAIKAVQPDHTAGRRPSFVASPVEIIQALAAVGALRANEPGRDAEVCTVCGMPLNETEALLAERDRFIVSKGLWSEFAEGLSRPPAVPIPVNMPTCRHGKGFLEYCPECKASERWNPTTELELETVEPAVTPTDAIAQFVADLAKQRLSDEMYEEEELDADFQGAFEDIVKTARRLKASPPAVPTDAEIEEIEKRVIACSAYTPEQIRAWGHSEAYNDRATLLRRLKAAEVTMPTREEIAEVVGNTTAPWMNELSDEQSLIVADAILELITKKAGG